jgi:hypothetical protein
MLLEVRMKVDCEVSMISDFPLANFAKRPSERKMEGGNARESYECKNYCPKYK